MTHKLIKVAFLLGAAALAGSFAIHPATAQPTPGAGSGSAKPPENDGSDQKLYNCKTGTTRVDVTFKPETELKDLITWVMGFTCKNYILDPRIVSTGKKVTIIAPNKMTANEAYDTFLVALSTMGLTVVPKGNRYRIVDSATAQTETVPIIKKGVPGNQDQVVRYILRPSYVQTETLRAALDQVRSPAGNVTAAGSLIVITDYASQVRDMMSLARAIDVPGNNEGIYTIPVLHADANNLKQKLDEILGLSGGGGGAAGGAKHAPTAPNAPPGSAPAAAGGGGDASIPSKILVDDRTNTLIVVASEPAYQRVKALVERLDIALDTEGGSSIHVYPLDNALAEELAQTLNNALGQGGQRPGQAGKPGQPGAPGQAPPPPAPSGPIVPTGEGNFGASLEGQVRVIGDKPTNSLIVVSSGRDYL